MRMQLITVFTAAVFLITAGAKIEASELIKDTSPDNPSSFDTGYGKGKIVVCGSNKIYIVNLKNSTSKEQAIE